MAPDLDRPSFFCNICKPTGGWDGIALVEEFSDVKELSHKEAVRLLARTTGYESESTTQPTLEVAYLKEDSDAFRAVQSHRPEIPFAAFERAGAMIFVDDKRRYGIAVPMFGVVGELSGYVRYFTSGGKPMNSVGSKSGIVGIDARDALLSKRPAKTIFKTAGVSDYLVMSSVIAENGLEADHYAFTNGAGENENPEKFKPILRPALEGKAVIVLQDNDEAGEAGALKWAKHLAKYAADVRIIRPPQDWSGKPIKDFRDFVAVANDTSEVLDWIAEAFEKAEPITPDKSPWSSGTLPKQSKADKLSQTNGTIHPILVRVSDLTEKTMQWLWENKIPLGMLSLITGLAGVGKSFWTVFMTAVITNGWKWPDGNPSEEGSVLFFYGEEGIEDTYKKRFRANGADQSKIVFLNGAESIDENKECSEIDVTLAMVDVIEKAIESTAEKTGFPVKMVVIDPISNYWGDVKENSNADVRSVLKPLQHLAERTGVAFVMIQHEGKGDKEYVQQRILGSTGIVAACRSVWGVCVAPDDKGKRIFAKVKANCGHNHTAVSYRIIPPDGAIEIVEASIENLTMDDIANVQRQAKAGAGRPPIERNACAALLADNLKDGRKSAPEMKKMLIAEGFSKDTIKAAKESLGVVAFQDGSPKCWYWHIPSDSDVDDAD